MRNLDEILADAKGKNVDRFQPHAHDTRTAVETEVQQPKATPTVKEHKARKISTRGLLLLLVLAIAGIGSVAAFASASNSGKGPSQSAPCQALIASYWTSNPYPGITYTNNYTQLIRITAVNTLSGIDVLILPTHVGGIPGNFPEHGTLHTDITVYNSANNSTAPSQSYKCTETY